MIPAGYMYKQVGTPPEQLTAKNVVDIFCIGGCFGGNSPFFTDYIKHFEHNGYGFFDSPFKMQSLATKEEIDLASMTLFYYELYELQFDRKEDSDAKHNVDDWQAYEAFPHSETKVDSPASKVLAGFDVVEYVSQFGPECSLLSCCNLAAQFEVNSHCLFDTMDQAKAALETGAFLDKEPGPYRILSVWLVNS